MPFQSKAQQRYLYAKHPEVAKRFAAETPKSAYKNLPKKVSPNRKPKGSYNRQQAERTVRKFFQSKGPGKSSSSMDGC